MLYLIFTQAITVGQFFSLFIYSFFIFGPLQEIGNGINLYRETEVSLHNFEEIMKTPTETKPANPVQIGPLNSLTFENVSFTHRSGRSHALTDVSFTLGAGRTAAFVGPSGAGKTTLVKLLVGLYTPESGRVLFNGVSGLSVDLDAMRERIGIVTQDTQLFAGTIRENLLFVNPAATDAECLEALQHAACHNLLSRADNGLDTVIGEGGVKVSGGEKQRLSIARALLRHPDLLVFDEATSSLDSLTENDISTTVREVSKREGLMTILIAHRLSTVLHADEIFVLEKGRIVESGAHETLLELKGLYYAMWRQQIGERVNGELSDHALSTFPSLAQR
jgi:ATP-binding cassette subfamily B protein